MIQGTPADIQRLSNLVFEGTDLVTFLNAAEDILINPISFSPFHRPSDALHSRSFPSVPAYEQMSKQEQEERNNYVLMRMSSLGDEPIITQGGPGVPHGHILCWAKEKDHCHGLINIANTKIPLETIDLSLVKFIGSCIAHLCAIHSGIQRRLDLDEALDHLIAGRIENHLQLSTLMPDGALKPDSFYTQAIFRLPPQKISTAGAYLRNQLKEMFTSCWCTWNNDHFIVLLDFRMEKGNASLSKIQQVSEHFSCPVCISPPYGNLLSTQEIYEHMASLPHFQRSEGSRLFFIEDYPESKLIYRSHLQPGDISLLSTTLYQQIRQYDEENNAQYLTTLLTYLRSNCSVAKTAKQLFIHPNSVLYRINRVQEIFDFDLSDENAVFGILFSARLQEYC